MQMVAPTPLKSGFAFNAPHVHCRLCDASLSTQLVDLGAQPSANAYLRADQLSSMEPTWPLRAYVCDSCGLVQIETMCTARDLFTDYAYFSSYSQGWLDHAEKYTADMLQRFGRERIARAVEIASNDGYLLQYFVREGIPVLGIDPAANVAAAAEKRGVPTLVRFFGRDVAQELADEGKRADLIAANNVLAHVPDIHDFVEGLGILVSDHGVITVEFPHVLNLIEQTQFDSIYHEHFSYLSLGVVSRVFEEHGLTVFDVEELPTHGGSLRVYASLAKSQPLPSHRVNLTLIQELAAGLDNPDTYTAFAARTARIKRNLLRTLMNFREEGRSVAAYGAPAKGNTLLNYCGIGPDLVSFTVDRNPYKQGRWLPGSRIPIHAAEYLREAKPDYLLILPWNLKDEIMQECSFIRAWGGKFVMPVPDVTVLP